MTRYWWPGLYRSILSVALMAIVSVPAGYGDETPDGEAAKESQNTPGPIKLTGTFEAIRQFEVSADNQHLTDLKLERIVPFGAAVTKEQTLVWFETEPLDDKIRSAETDLALARLDLESDEFTHQQFLKKQALDKAKADRDRKLAQQTYDNYQRADRDRAIKQAEFSLASSEFSLESATEEYRQLEQMYKEDDLTEESEEIVLRRAKRAMESAAFSLERAKIQAERTIKQSIPNDDANQEDALTRATMDHEKSVHSLSIEKQKRDLELQRKRRKVNDQADELGEMRTERKKVVLKSDIDGIFVYGEIVRGKLPAKQVRWDKGSSVNGKQVLGTVVDPSKLQVRMELPEEHLATVRAGVTCKVIPKSMPGVELNGVVKSVGIVPIAAEKYDCVINVRGKSLADVLPAMTCDVLFARSQPDPSDSTKSKGSQEK